MEGLWVMQQEAEILQLALKVPGGSVNSAIAKYLCWVAAFYLDFHGMKSTGLFRSHTCAPDPSHPWKKKVTGPMVGEITKLKGKSLALGQKI